MGIHHGSKEDTGILSIVDKDIQENIIDSSQFHESLKEELMDVQRKLMGISDDEFETMKQELRVKKEKQEQEEAIKRQVRLEKDKNELDYRNNFRIKEMTNGRVHSNAATAHRVHKVPRINLKSKNASGGDSPSEAKVEKKKVTKMM